MNKRIIIIGAGPGALTSGMLLAHRGYDVTILEKGASVGGRNAPIHAGPYTFDTGPTFLHQKFTLDEVFDTGELFYQLEVGWSALARSGVPVQARGPMDSNNVHVTGWYKDSQPDQSNVTLQPQARGLAFNANWMVGDNLMWFLRAGASEGWVNDRSVSAGFGWRPDVEYSDLFGFGIGWVRPNTEIVTVEAFQREQWNVETFYRFHVTPNFAITPDLQYISNPSLNPEVDSLWIGSLRARVTF